MSINSLIYIDANGFHYPDYSDVLEYLTTQYQQIYGADVNLSADTQDGQWLAVQTAAFYDLTQLCVATYNSFNPSTALSDALSRDVKINGIRRKEATSSTVDLVLIGQAGTTIVNGKAEDILKQLWDLPASVTIPPSGTITVTATADKIGAIEALPNTITTIATPTLGWQSVNNISSAAPGAPVEADAELRIRQTVAVALPSLSVFEGTIGAVASVPGVTAYAGYENDTNLTDSNGIPPHTISMVVQGGDSQAIANAIAVKKTPGTGTYGTTVVSTIDAYGLINYIKFYRPTIKVIAGEITIKALPGYTTGYAAQIQNSVAAFINALGIGQDVYISRLFCPALLSGIAGTTYNVTQIQLSADGGPLSSSDIVVAFNELAQCTDPTTITITVIP